MEKQQKKLPTCEIRPVHSTKSVIVSTQCLVITNDLLIQRGYISNEISDKINQSQQSIDIGVLTSPHRVPPSMNNKVLRSWPVTSKKCSESTSSLISDSPNTLIIRPNVMVAIIPELRS